MLLAIDVGNTETKLGVFSGGERDPHQTWRVTTELHRTADEYGVFFTQLFATGGVRAREIDAIVIASVVPKLDNVLQASCERFFGATPDFLKAQRQSLIAVDTERPSEVGADLIATAIGARERFGKPLIVVSYGTATVFMGIAGDGRYSGVAIAPGINTSIDALIERTAKLPQIALEDPGRALGRNTIEALQAGIVYGFVGQTESLVARFRAEMGGEVRVVATGGLAEFVSKHTKVIDAVDPHLSLVGLRLYYGSLQ
jgi:type III pantothenate kinase